MKSNLIKKFFVYLPLTGNYNTQGQIPTNFDFRDKPRVVVFRKGIRILTLRVIIASHALGPLFVNLILLL